MRFRFWNMPNSVTFLRVLCVPALWVLALLNLNHIFILVFTFAGFTDAADGYLARRLRQTTAFGAWFDSFADNLVAISLLPWFWLLLNEFVITHLTTLLVILTLFVLNLVVGMLKFKRMIHYHLYSSKLSTMLLYVFTLHALVFFPNDFFFISVAVLVAMNQAEEIVATVLHKKIDTSRNTFL